MNTDEIEPTTSSPLDIEGIDLDITTDEIIEFIAEGRAILEVFHDGR